MNETKVLADIESLRNIALSTIWEPVGFSSDDMSFEEFIPAPVSSGEIDLFNLQESKIRFFKLPKGRSAEEYAQVVSESAVDGYKSIVFYEIEADKPKLISMFPFDENVITEVKREEMEETFDIESEETPPESLLRIACDELSQDFDFSVNSILKAKAITFAGLRDNSQWVKVETESDMLISIDGNSVGFWDTEKFLVSAQFKQTSGARISSLFKEVKDKFLTPQSDFKSGKGGVLFTLRPEDGIVEIEAFEVIKGTENYGPVHYMKIDDFLATYEEDGFTKKALDWTKGLDEGGDLPVSLNHPDELLCRALTSVSGKNPKEMLAAFLATV